MMLKYMILFITLSIIDASKPTNLDLKFQCELKSTVRSLLEVLGFSHKCIINALVECNNTYSLIGKNQKFDDLMYSYNNFGQLQLSDICPKCFASAISNCYSKNENNDTYSEPVINLPSSMNIIRPRTCDDLLKNGDSISGLKTIYPWKAYSSVEVTVYCDQVTDGGGWTVIQRRQVGQVREDFYRTWLEYSLGFGNKEEEFWLGNDLISDITSLELHQLKILMKDVKNETRWAQYDYFHVGPKSSKYKLHAGRYTGDAGDGFGTSKGNQIHSGAYFSTKDQDHDTSNDSCAQLYKGGWWYAACHVSNLNGFQHEGYHDKYAEGINWHPWHGYHESLVYTVMMIRPVY